MVVAEATTRLRIGPLVLNNEFHHPALVARTAATIDRLTNGRLVLGLGTGCRRAGLPLRRHEAETGRVCGIRPRQNVSVERLPETMPSPRLTLRRWVAADAAILAAAITANVDHLRPWMPWITAEPVSLADRVLLLEQWQNEWERGGDVVIGAFLDGAVVGSTGLHRRRGPGALEIGYWVHVDHIREGIATELASALTTAAFGVAGIERVEIHHDKANVASAGVPRALGYTFIDETQDSVTSPGEVGIDCRWAITRQQWMEKVSAS